MSGCTTENSPDVLGLSAEGDVLVAHNNPLDQVTQSTQDCLANFGDGTGTPVNTPTPAMLSGNPYNGQQVTGVHVTNNSPTVTISSGSFANDGIVAGADVSVTGTTGIPSGTTVSSINGTSLTLSANANASSSNDTLTFTDPGLQNDPAAVWPTLCDTIASSGIYVDAAVFALSGSLGSQNWDDAVREVRQSEWHGPQRVPRAVRRRGLGGLREDDQLRPAAVLHLTAVLLPQGVPLWQLINYVECPNASCPAIG